jgi:hypothetical protein
MSVRVMLGAEERVSEGILTVETQPRTWVGIDKRQELHLRIELTCPKCGTKSKWGNWLKGEEFCPTEPLLSSMECDECGDEFDLVFDLEIAVKVTASRRKR